MTAIARQRTPSVAWAGLLLPGLGHLLSGEPIVGCGLLLLDALLVAAAAHGFLEYRAIFDAHPTHGPVALVSWVVLVGFAYLRGARRAVPRLLSEEERARPWNLFASQFSRHRTGMAGLVGAGLLLALTLLTPFLATFDPDATNMGPVRAAPDLVYLLGTDERGRDLFSRVLYGARISLCIGFLAVSIAATVGTLVGAVAGYLGGWVDRTLMFGVDMLLSLPRLVLLLAIVGLFRMHGESAIVLIVVVLGLTGWMGVSRLVRAQVLSLKEQEFILAARALGLSTPRIILRHLVPNAMAPVIVYSSLAIGTTILTEAGLSFLGLGVPPPTSTWGTLVEDGRESLRQAPWIAIFPGLMIVYAVMTFNLLGDGLRDTLDPKLKGEL